MLKNFILGKPKFYNIYGVDKMVKSLLDVDAGDEVTIVKYEDSGSTDLKRHLLGMGFVRGSKIKIQKIAPLGDPIEFKIKGYDVCLRKEEAKNIIVE